MPMEAPLTQRSLQACIRCRRSKVRCGGSVPCDRCSKAGLSCVYPRSHSSILSFSPSLDTASASAEMQARVADMQHELTTLQREHERALQRCRDGEMELTQLRVSAAQARSPYKMDSAKMDRAPSPVIDVQRVEVPRPYLAKGQADIFANELGYSSEDRPNRTSPLGLIEARIVTMLEAESYFETYKRLLSDRNPLLQPIVQLPGEPTLLRDVIISLGLRAQSPRSSLHIQCARFTRSRLANAGRIDLSDVHAALLWGGWYADIRMIRMAIGWAHEIGLHRSALNLQAFISAVNTKVDPLDVSREAAMLTSRFRLWLSCCNAELHMCLYAGVPAISRDIDQSIQAALHWFSLAQTPNGPLGGIVASQVTEFDILIVSYSEMVSILLAYREALPLSLTDPESGTACMMEDEVEGLMDRCTKAIDSWADKWHVNEKIPFFEDARLQTTRYHQDRDRVRGPYAFARCYIHSFALRGVVPAGPAISESRSRSIRMATGFAIDAVELSLDLKVYEITLNCSMEFLLRHAFGFSLGFLFAVMMFAPHLACSSRMSAVLGRLDTILTVMAEDTGSGDGLRNLRYRVHSLALKAAVFLQSMPQTSSPSIPQQTLHASPTLFDHTLPSDAVLSAWQGDQGIQTLLDSLIGDPNMWCMNPEDDFWN